MAQIAEADIAYLSSMGVNLNKLVITLGLEQLL